MNILGISCFYHDAAAALIVDGELIAAAEEERFSRIKHDHNFPEKAIKFCLDRAHLTGDELDLVVFYEKPFWKFDRILMSTLSTWPKSAVAFREAMLVWLLDKLWARDIIQERVNCSRDRLVFCPHHLAHAASAYYPSGFDKASILTVDGVGEWACGSRGAAWDNKVIIEDEMRYPHSLGLLYSAFTAFLGFQVNEGEYKVMGMAPYGRPIYRDEIFEKLVELRDDGSFRLNMDYFAYHYSAYHSFSPKFEALFGRPRTSNEANLLDPHYADIAASIQQVAEEILLAQTAYLHAKTGHDNLCMAGGVALNSAANYRIFKDSGYKHIFIQPAAGDGGGALGAALWGYYELLGGTRRFTMKHCYWGQSHSDAEIADFLRQEGVKFCEFRNMDEAYDEVALRLDNSQVIGWMQGGFEWGPRALGARSILADPRSAMMKDVVNARIKFREPFRPFAPSVMLEGVESFFELEDAANIDLIRFMLMVAPVREDKKSLIPAVTHVDGTSRLQAVHREVCPLYHAMISRFYQRSGVPLVLNTSFNLRGEPIVNTPAEAYSTFARSDMDALLMGRFLVSRRAAGEGRLTPGAELEKWAHAPRRATGTEQRPESSESQTSNTVSGAFGPMEVQASEPFGLKSALAWTGKALLVLLFALIVCELIVRFAIPNPNMQVRGMYSQNEQGIRLQPGWTGRVHSSEFDVNLIIDKQGQRVMPEPKPQEPDTRAGKGNTILALGDSFTFGCWSSADKTWLADVQNVTGARVINAGLPNAGTDTVASIVQDTRPKASLWILSFYTGNDFYDNMLGQESFTLDGGYLVLKPEAERQWAQYDCLTGQGLDQGTSGNSWIKRCCRRSYLYQYVRSAFAAGSKRVGPSSAQAWFLKKYTPEMREGLEKTYASLRQIKEAADKQGAQLVLVVIPSSIEVYDQDWQGWLKFAGQDEKLFDRKRPRQLITDWAEQHSVAALDLYDSFAARERLYYRGDMHWTDLGHFQAGEAVVNFLRKQNIFDYSYGNDLKFDDGIDNEPAVAAPSEEPAEDEFEVPSEPADTEPSEDGFSGSDTGIEDM